MLLPNRSDESLSVARSGNRGLQRAIGLIDLVKSEAEEANCKA